MWSQKTRLVSLVTFHLIKIVLQFIMFDGNAGHVSPPEGPVDTNEYREQHLPTQQRMHDARRSANDLVDDEEGWDVVPPIMSIGSNATVWKEVSASKEGGRMQYRNSLQHLGTLVVPDSFGTTDAAASRLSQSARQPLPPTSISTTPLAFCAEDTFSYYLVAGCHDGTICLWNMMHLPALKAFLDCRQSSFVPRGSRNNGGDDSTADDDNSSSTPPNPLHCIDTLTSIQPLQVVDTLNTESHNRKTAAIVQICQLPHDHVSSDIRFAAVNMLGMVYIITSSEKTTLNISASFETGRLTPTCVSYLNDSTIVIGYQSGFLEAWSMQKAFDDTGNTDSSQTEATQSNIDSTPHSIGGSFSLSWRATFADFNSGPAPAINAVATLNTVAPPPKHSDLVNEDTPANSEDAPSFMERTDGTCYLALTSYHNDPTRPNSASMLEVVDVTSIADSWIQLLESNSNAINDEDLAVPLEDHCVLPEVGREIMESSTVEDGDKSRHHPTTNWIPSRSTNRLCSIPLSNSLANRIAVGLADGMVAVLDSRECDDGQTQWGASPHIDQFCLSFPCIGMNCLKIAESRRNPALYVACCLRGSSTYLIPLNTSQSSNDSTATVLAVSVPHGFDEDASIRYVQDFTAFNLVLSHVGEERLSDPKDSIPLLVYVWPGGVIDVYSYGLLSCTHSLPDEKLIQELVSDGSIATLRNVLLNSGGDYHGVHEMWTAAVEEVSRLDRDIPIAIENIYSERFTGFREVLLHLAL
jgi:hypothetical protein